MRPESRVDLKSILFIMDDTSRYLFATKKPALSCQTEPAEVQVEWAQKTQNDIICLYSGLNAIGSGPVNGQ